MLVCMVLKLAVNSVRIFTQMDSSNGRSTTGEHPIRSVSSMQVHLLKAVEVFVHRAEYKCIARVSSLHLDVPSS